MSCRKSLTIMKKVARLARASCLPGAAPFLNVRLLWLDLEAAR
jgi:hypothetical protein